MITPDYEGKKTVQELQQAYDSWASSVSKAQFAKDKDISVNNSNFEQLYEQEYAANPRKFFIANLPDARIYYYFGDDKDTYKNLKNQYYVMNNKQAVINVENVFKGAGSELTAVGTEIEETIVGTYSLNKEQRNKVMQTAEDIKSGKLTEEQKQVSIEKLNKELGTNISADASYTQLKKIATARTGGVVGEIEEGWKDIEQLAEGEYVFSEAARKELGDTAAKWDTMSEEDKKKWISEFNSNYNANISVNATAKTLTSAANKKNGILHITGNDIADSIKKEIKNASNLAHYWDESESKTIKKFTDQGITGDIMWDTIRGKYNKDDKARKDLEKLATLVNEGKGNSEEAIQLRNKINKQYDLKLDENVTADDITKIIASDQKYTYKKKIREIAEGIIEDKLNESIRNHIEKRLGGKLEDWGIQFKDGNIVQAVRDIIRGNKVAFFNQEKFFKKLQDTLEKKIDKMIEEKVKTLVSEKLKEVNAAIDSATDQIKSGIDNAATSIINAIDPFRTKVDNIYSKLDSWLTNPDSAKLTIADKLDQLIKSPVDGIANTLNKIEPFKKLGINLGLGDMFKKVSTSFTKGLSEKLYSMTRPFVEKALGIVSKVRTQIKKLITTIDKIKEKAKQLIEQWKEKIKQIVTDFTKKLVNELSKYVKVAIGNFVGGIADTAGGLLGGISL